MINLGAHGPASEVLEALIVEAERQGQPKNVTDRLRDALAILPRIEQGQACTST